MTIKNIFEEAGAQALISRIEQLNSDTPALWGKMNVSQMLAHCSRPFESIYDPAYAKAHPRPNRLVRSLLRLFIKPIVVGEKPYKKNMRTAPEFIVDDDRDFEIEQRQLVEFIKRVQAEGVSAFEGRDSHSFGPLTSKEWNILFYKHTDHHLAQFGV